VEIPAIRLSALRMCPPKRARIPSSRLWLDRKTRREKKTGPKDCTASTGCPQGELRENAIPVENHEKIGRRGKDAGGSEMRAFPASCILLLVFRHPPNCSVSLFRSLFKSLSALRTCSILSTECMTVVWCLPPNWRPISGREASVRCLARYMAICRG